MTTEADAACCVVPGCGRPLYQSRIYCGAHRGRFYAYGDPLGSAPPRRRDLTGQRFGTLLALEYVDAAHGWLCRCDCGHELTVRTWSLTSGGTRTCGRKRRHLPPATSYSDMHWRLRALLGPASDRICAGCGRRRAQQWAYRQHAARERLTAPEGPWSTNLDDYWPLCVRCHKRADLGSIARSIAAKHGAQPLWEDNTDPTGRP